MENIAVANRRRIELLAGHVVSRLGNERAGLWAGYTSDEELMSRLDTPNHITYWRKSAPLAKIGLFNIEISGTEGVTRSEPTIIGEDVIDRFSGVVHTPEGVSYKQTLTHQFKEITTLSQAVKAGAELSAKATVSAEYAGIKGSLEVAAKLYAEYNRQWGSSEEMTDTVERTIEVEGGKSVRYEAVRRRTKEERTITGKPKMSYNIAFLDERSVNGNEGEFQLPRFLNIHWSSFDEFVAVGEGLASAEVPLYQEFQDGPLNDEEVQTLKDTSTGEISYTAKYDNVISQEINIVDDES